MQNIPVNTNWQLIYTKPKHENRVADFLKENNIIFFLPKANSIKVRQNRKSIVAAPLFPSYIFVQTSTVKDFYQVLECSSILYYVRFGKAIAQINESIINNLKIVVDKNPEIEITSLKYKPHQLLVINKGALVGLKCEVIENNNETKLLVRLNILQRNILINISVNDVMVL